MKAGQTSGQRMENASVWILYSCFKALAQSFRRGGTPVFRIVDNHLGLVEPYRLVNMQQHKISEFWIGLRQLGQSRDVWPMLRQKNGDRVAPTLGNTAIVTLPVQPECPKNRGPAIQMVQVLIGGDSILIGAPCRGKPWRPSEFPRSGYSAENKKTDGGRRQNTHFLSPIVSNGNLGGRIARRHGIMNGGGALVRRANTSKCSMIHT